MHLDNLLQEIGSFGKFQIVLILLVNLPILGIAYNMLIMAFGVLEPDWWCVDPLEANSNVTTYRNTTYKQCNVDLGDNSTCQRIYEDHTRTVVSEWDLVCEKKWIPPIITSLQMGGVLIGAIIGGQLADSLGRKKTFYATLLLHSVFSISIAFVRTWQLFAVFRFLIGVTLGSYKVVCMFTTEFLGFRWRPVITTVPFWSTGVCLLSLSTWVLHDWAKVHLAVGIYSIPFVLGWFFVPESIRWLAVKGKIEEAMKVVNMVANMNKKTPPANTKELIMKIAEEERSKTKSGKQYSYLDIFRKKKMAVNSIGLYIVWWCISACYFGFAFGVGKLAGNFYLNQFLMSATAFPVFIPVTLYMNKYGRRSLILLMLGLALTSSIAIIIVIYTVGTSSKGVVITILCLATGLFFDQTWASMVTLTNESYPTVIRNIGYGAASTVARFGGIVASFMFALNDNEVVPFVIVVILMAISGSAAYFLVPETLGCAMEDLLPHSEDTNENEIKMEVDIDDERPHLTAFKQTANFCDDSLLRVRI